LEKFGGLTGGKGERENACSAREAEFSIGK
jgi:hypothetical protein